MRREELDRQAQALSSSATRRLSCSSERNYDEIIQQANEEFKNYRAQESLERKFL
jgi:hypothetical protein